MSPQDRLFLVSMLLIHSSSNVASFTIPSSRNYPAPQSQQERAQCNVQRNMKTLLLSSYFPTEGYLSSLTTAASIETPKFSVTDRYLESLSQMAGGSGPGAVDTFSIASNPEEYIHHLSRQVAEQTSISSDLTNLQDMGSMFLADASSKLGSPEALQMANDVSSGDSGSSLMYTLNGISYDSMVGDAKFASTLGETSTKFTNAGSTFGTDFAKFSNQFTSATDASLSSIGNFFGKAGASVASSLGEVGVSVSSKITDFPQALVMETNKASTSLSTSTQSTVDSVGQKTLVELGKDVAGGIEIMGDALSRVLSAVNSVLIDNTGTSVLALVESAQISMTTLFNNAIQSVVGTIHDIENMTVSQVIQNLISLLAVLSKIAYAVLNAIVKLVSGQGINDYALATTHALEQKANMLTAQASASVNDLTHASLSDLSHLIGQFSQEVAAGVTALASGSIDGVGAALQMTQVM